MKELLATRAGSDPDLDLEALPAPRRPWRRATLIALSLSALGSLGLAFALRGEAVFALSGGPPVDLGELNQFHPASANANTWVHGNGTLRADGAVRYSRPLESDSYRLAQLEGNDRLWVQISVPDDPSDPEGAHFVAPTSFVGRLIPVSSAGIRHGVVRAAVSDAWQGKVTDDSWLLVDGEAPRTTRWALGLCGLFLGFAAFSVFGLLKLTQKVS
ncbi:MAG TPA: hypothetical protein VFK05_17685 [Polyangiaceae bacterium]|nr:hypothetical protein [Polyangiaceae bacterium]